MSEWLRECYLELVKRCVLGLIYEDEPMAVFGRTRTPGRFDRRLREYGLDWPSRAHSMIGEARMNNVLNCVTRVLDDGIPGDLMEAGVWRGGTAILMRAILKAHDVRDRCVWLADSFQGVPPPDEQRYPRDAGIRLDQKKELAVSVTEVRANFARYNLLDEQVRFVPGWFRDTLRSAPCERLAVLRLDGDLYESTIQSLTYLYPKLAAGGFVIVDDYGAIGACREAVDDFRRAHGICGPMYQVDWSGIYWRRT